MFSSAVRTKRRVVTALIGGLVLALFPAFADTVFDYGLEPGTHWVALPFEILAPPLASCGDLLAFVNEIGAVSDVRRFDTPTGSEVSCLVAPFDLIPGESYTLVVEAPTGFSILGNDGTTATQLRTGATQIGLPRTSPLNDAEELGLELGGFSNDAGPVLNIQQFLSAGGTIEVYDGTIGVPFALTPGTGYRVQLNQDVDFLPRLRFRTFPNRPLGGASLVLREPNLEIRNIGSSGLDGALIENPLAEVPAPETAHEDWIDLGLVQLAPITAPGDVANGAFIEFNATATLTGAAGTHAFVTHIEDVGSEVEITSDLSASNATSLRYEVRLGGVLQGTPVSVAINPPAVPAGVTAGAWPTVSAFSEIKWSRATDITLPSTPTPTTLSGDALWIFPENHEFTLNRSQTLKVTARSTGAESSQGSSPLAQVTIVRESFSGSAESSVLPALSVGGMLSLVLTLLAAGGYLVYHRRRRDTSLESPAS